MDLYILLDTSGSMEGAKIAALNDCMQNIVISLQDYANNGSVINIDVLSFARSARWMHDKIKAILDFDWMELKAGGMTSLGNACLLLSERLDNQHSEEEKHIILISDGCPTDDYANDIVTLKCNEIFDNAERYAIAIGDDADIPSLVQFASETNKVYTLANTSELLDILTRIISSTGTQHTGNTRITSADDDDDWS